MKVELEIPEQIWNFLKAVAEFSCTDQEGCTTPETFIRKYVLKSVLDSVENDVSELSYSTLWTEQQLRGRYHLDEVLEPVKPDCAKHAVKVRCQACGHEYAIADDKCPKCGGKNWSEV